MTNWRPASDPAAAHRRANMLERARQYFADQNVLAVDTPALGKYACADPNIDSLSVQATNGSAFLQTSPEIYMKRLLASGYPDIYSVCRVFRGGESGKRHIEEFTIAEWYRLGFELNAMIDDTIGFISACLLEQRLAETIRIFSHADAFEKFANIDVFDASIDELANQSNADASLRSAIGMDRSAWIDLLFSTIVAPQFAQDQLTVVRHYPASQAALARLCPADERVADRFEVFYGDLELANGYVELTDADEQRRRLDRDLRSRQQPAGCSAARDETLLAALDAGLPMCAGVAVGIERLHMVLDQTDDISDVVTFVAKN